MVVLNKRAVFCLAVAMTCTISFAVETSSSTQTTTPPLRIMSLNGGATEVLFALGAGSLVVGRDDSSYYPPAVLEIPSVGYQYMLNSEALLALKANLVVGRADAKPESALSRLREAGTAMLVRPEPTTVHDAKARIVEVGEAVGAGDAANKLVTEIESDSKELSRLIAEQKASGKPVVKAAALYVRGASTALILGNNTGPASMIEIAGGENVFKDITGSKPLSPEALAAAAPDVIVVLREGVKSAGGVEAFLSRPAVALTPAGKNSRLVIMEDLYLGGFGPRVGKAAIDLHKGFYHSTGIYQADGTTTSPALVSGSASKSANAVH